MRIRWRRRHRPVGARPRLHRALIWADLRPRGRAASTGPLRPSQ